MRGDATLFDRGDIVEAAWSLVDPILDVWSAAKTATVPTIPVGKLGAQGIRPAARTRRHDSGTTHEFEFRLHTSFAKYRFPACFIGRTTLILAG